MSWIPNTAILFCRASAGGAREERTETGLVKGHAYGVTAVRKVPIGATGLAALFKYSFFFIFFSSVEVSNSQRISCLDSSLGRAAACGAGGRRFAPRL
jgi:hypothetical protein